MKAKATTTANATDVLVDHLNRLRPVLEREVLEPYFEIPGGAFGPAEFFVQETDIARYQEPFIHYMMSGITYKDERDFEAAVEVLLDILAALVREHWLSQKIQIFVVIFTAESSDQMLYEGMRWVNTTKKNAA